MTPKEADTEVLECVGSLCNHYKARGKLSGGPDERKLMNALLAALEDYAVSVLEDYIDQEGVIKPKPINKMHRVCKNCGVSFGKHSFYDEKCPKLLLGFEEDIKFLDVNPLPSSGAPDV